MPFDGFVLAAIRQELEQKITGGRIDRIYQPQPVELLLVIHRPGERLRLVASIHPQNARLHLSSKTKENPITPPFFCLVLRKHLEGGRIRKIQQPGLERMLIMNIESQEEMGKPSSKLLIYEIMGKHSNIILVDPASNQIIDGIKRYSHAMSRYREVLPGRPYIPPPVHNKLNPFHLQEEEFQLALLNQPLDAPLENILQHCFDGFSRVMSREVVYRAGLPVTTVLDHCGEYELHRLWEAFQQIIIPASQNKFQPTLISNHRGELIDFAAFDLTHYTNFYRKHGEMNNLIDQFFLTREEKERQEEERTFLLKIVQKETSRLARKLSLQERNLNRAEEIQNYRLYGELLMANIQHLKKGMDKVILENFYDSNSSVCIPLEPSLTPVENAQAYFRKYAKAKSARETAQNLINEIKDELAYLEGVQTALEQASSEKELAEIKMELGEQGYLKEEHKRKDREFHPQPHVFTSSEGFTILVGSNNTQNDYLTMRLARNNDVWLHTRNIPGAHVVIRSDNRPVTPTVIQEAACLAAYYSRARNSTNVPVDYTWRKNVKKPRKARPGFVTYTGQRTINVTPDEKLVERLRKQT